jgi:acyl-CoA synthetase (AMP-forming)/AMP-acid ligase II
VADCQPAAAIVDGATFHDEAARRSLAQVPAVFVAGRLKPDLELSLECQLLPDALAGVSAASPGVRVIDIDLAAIIYTSGSTGESRGVMLSHRNLVSNAQSIASYLRLTAVDRVMCVLPFYYVYGLSLLHTHLAVGGSVVIDNRFAFPNVILGAMQHHSVTGFAGVPSTFALLLHRSNLAETTLPALRYVTQAGGPMAPPRIREWLERGPKVPFYVMYGATEASARLTYLEPSRLSEKLGSIGKAIPNVEIQIVKEDGTNAAPGEVGELVARGSNISRGYWNSPDESREKFGSRGYRTGDLGYVDEDGFVFLVGRTQDMLKVGAHRVGAKEIEEVLHDYPGIQEVAVVGAPHELLGEVPVAFVCLESETERRAESLQAFCKSRLPSHKVPTQFIFLSDLPKLGSVGKIDRTRLRSMASAVGV